MYPSMVFIAKHYDQKPTWEKEAFILSYSSQSITKGSQDRNSRHGVGSRDSAEVINSASWLGCLEVLSLLS